MERIRSLVIPTCNRVDSVERTLLSHIYLAKEFGRDLDFIVADGSESLDYRNHTRAVLRSIARFHGVRVFYLGLEEKQAFAEALAQAAGAPRDTIDFALFGTPHAASRAGANRNALLLECIDQLFYSTDDDTAGRIFRPASCDDRTLDVHAGGDRVWDGYTGPGDFVWRIHPSLDSALRETEEFCTDLLALHERFLGQRIADLQPRFEKVIHHGPRAPSSADANARVMFTMTGLLGDIGVEERWHLLAMTPEVLSQQLSEEAYRRALDSRIVVRCARRTTLTRWVGLHGMFFGADHRRILPPFFPMFRGQDTLMGWTARRCYPHDSFALLPCTQMHLPAPRNFSRGFEFLLCGRSIASVLIELLPVVPAAASPEAALGEMGGRLTALGNLPPSEFTELLRCNWRAGAGPSPKSLISALHSQKLEHVRTGLKRVLSTSHRLREQHDGSLPLDVLEGRTPEETRALTQELVRRFGALLSAWPQIVESTRHLRAQGTRAATALV